MRTAAVRHTTVDVTDAPADFSQKAKQTRTAASSGRFASPLGDKDFYPSPDDCHQSAAPEFMSLCSVHTNQVVPRLAAVRGPFGHATTDGQGHRQVPAGIKKANRNLVASAFHKVGFPFGVRSEFHPSVRRLAGKRRHLAS